MQFGQERVNPISVIQTSLCCVDKLRYIQYDDKRIITTKSLLYFCVFNIERNVPIDKYMYSLPYSCERGDFVYLKTKLLRNYNYLYKNYNYTRQSQ